MLPPCAVVDRVCVAPAATEKGQRAVAAGSCKKGAAADRPLPLTLPLQA